ncbi:MAG: agmatinase, partial [Candidatus Diapherotrites archaeon]|nr:agmatinase [Candidatus Diapherotrites archaeon]
SFDLYSFSKYHNYMFKQREPKFLDWPEADYKKARAVILPAPFDGTASYMKGASKGPSAIIDASRQIEWFDLELGFEPCKKFVCFTAQDLELEGKSAKNALKEIESAFGKLLSDKKFVLMLGGDHSVSIGAFPALQKQFGKDLTVLQLDAHTDLGNPWVEPKPSHADVMMEARKRFSAVQAGIRALDVKEMKYIREKKLNDVFFMPDFNPKKIVGACSENVYLTIDLDALDPGIMPSTGTPVPGGIGYEQLLDLLRTLFMRKNVVGADIVELMPIDGLHAPDFLAAMICYKILAYKFLLGKK